MKCRDCEKWGWGDDEGTPVWGWCWKYTSCPDPDIDRSCPDFSPKKPDIFTTLSTLQAENKKLRAELENYRKGHREEAISALSLPNEWVNRVRELDELYTKLQIITGFTVEQLLEMFAAGYTLEKPDYSKSFEEMASLAETTPPNGWVSVEEMLPPEHEPVLCIVNGKPKPNITLEEAYQLGSWNKADGWIIDEYLDWEDADVSWWMPLPEPPEREG